jgi:hypothetical protein
LGHHQPSKKKDAAVALISLARTSRSMREMVRVNRGAARLALKSIQYCTHQRNSVVIFSGLDGFSTDLNSVLLFPRTCGKESTWVWLVGGRVHFAATVQTLIWRLDVYIHWPELYSGDDFDILFESWEAINAIKERLSLGMTALARASNDRNRQRPKKRSE